MSVLDKIGGELPATLTYARREWDWVPTAEGEGILTIRLWKGKRAGSKCEIDSYQVQEEDSPGCRGRSFLILNLTDPDQPDVYRCVVGGPYQHCTCTAGSVKRIESCKHRDSIKAMLPEMAADESEDRCPECGGDCVYECANAPKREPYRVPHNNGIAPWM